MAGPSHTTIWIWLLVLLAVGLSATAAPFGRTAAIALVLLMALIKASLVIRHYMHLKREPLIVYAIAAAPVLLIAVLALALVPDLVWRR
jgi:caa(3)-type oxidase subunit IV